MKKSTAELIEHYGSELRLRDSYSGRCMYGKTTYGIVGSESDYASAVTDAAGDIVENAFGQTEAAEQVVKFLEDALQATTDNMGYDTIWY